MTESRQPKPDDQAWITMRRLDHPATDELSEMLLLQADIRHSLDAISIWLRDYADKPGLSREETVIGNSLFRDAVVQFIGCFDKKALKQYSLDEKVIYASVEYGLEYFSWMLGMRNAYAAHKYGAYRQCSVGIVVDEKTGLHGVSMQPFFWASITKDGGPDLLHFMWLALKHVDERVDKLHKILLGEAKKLTEAQFLQLPVAKNFVLPTGQESMSRYDLKKAVVGGKPPSKSKRHSTPE